MRRIWSILILTSIIITSPVKGQINSGNISAELEKLFGRLRENFSSDEKLVINDSIRLIIENYVKSDTVFNHRFSNLRYLGQITSTDSLIKIITWNLILEDGVNKYFCYIVKRSEHESRSKVFNLSGLYKETPIKEDTTYSQMNWYGALYYDIRPFIFNNETNYVILGIDYGNSFITRKIIDILSFNSRNEPVFGKNCFTDGNFIKPRIVFEYASTAVMTLRFISDTSVVFDHLSPFSPEFKDNHQFYGPDFSFDSYNLENGYWRLITDIDIRNKE
jgi:hypothetical protein